ncbi:MAG: helix-turn-helix transcriptional regulator [Solirubrobacteraceae bacterium]
MPITGASAARATQDLVRLCHQGLDSAGLQQRMLPALRRVMTIDAAFFATADPNTLLFTGGHQDEPLVESRELFLANEFGAPDVNKFADLATSSRHVASLDEATRRDRSTSRRYREIMGPLGLGDELRAALVVDRQCWGYVCLHREDHELGFTAGEAVLLARVGPHLAHALRQAVLLHDPDPPQRGEAPGVVLLGENLDVIAVTSEAQHLLSTVEDGRPASVALPVAVHSAAAALLALESGATASPARPSTRARTRPGGWLDIHASRLQSPNGGPPPIAVVLERAQAPSTAPLLLAAHGLTARETEVARLVLRGASTTTIANTLHISRHTVQDHLKGVFDKVGVSSRRDLVGHLLGSAQGRRPSEAPAR